MNPCECGCGLEARTGRRFVQGHNGRKFSPEVANDPVRLKAIRDAWSAANRDLISIQKINSRARKTPEQKQADRERNLKHRYKSRYNMTLEEVRAWQESVEGCEICGGPATGRSPLKGNGAFVIDHCHETGLVRGLLCNRCNLLLGHAKDNLDTLQSAIKYLQKYGNLHASS